MPKDKGDEDQDLQQEHITQAWGAGYRITRINKAKGVRVTLRPILRFKELIMKTRKYRIEYGCETWEVTKQLTHSCRHSLYGLSFGNVMAKRHLQRYALGKDQSKAH